MTTGTLGRAIDSSPTTQTIAIAASAVRWPKIEAISREPPCSQPVWISACTIMNMQAMKMSVRQSTSTSTAPGDSTRSP
jgi:hypothetical protein